MFSVDQVPYRPQLIAVQALHTTPERLSETDRLLNDWVVALVEAIQLEKFNAQVAFSQLLRQDVSLLPQVEGLPLQEQAKELS
jgi:hypothetical protein